ncbi:MAG: hypothetical protein WCQ95_10360 [Bacteroidota bacterium]
MEFEEIYATLATATKRPLLLSRLCFVTFFFSGSMTLFSFGGLFLSGWMTNYINVFVQGFYNVGSTVFILFFLATFILFGSSFTGALLLFYGKRSGFWIYVAANAIMVFLSIFVVMNTVNVFFIIVSTIFVFLYAKAYKQMKNLQ